MVRVALAPCSPFSVTESLMVRSAELAERLDVRLHTHFAENSEDDAFSIERFGCRPTEYLERTGWCTDRTWVAHCVMPNHDEVHRLGRAGIGAAHCPSSNLILSSGISPVVALRAAGVKVGLGVDGSSSADSASLWLEARQAMLLAKLRDGAHSGTARMALEMATLGGAGCLGREGEIGVLAPGAVPEWAPCGGSMGRCSPGRSLIPSRGGSAAGRRPRGTQSSTAASWCAMATSSTTETSPTCSSVTAARQRASSPQGDDMSRPFRFGVFGSAATSGAEWKETARKAEDLGYSSLHVADHYVDAASNGGQALACVPAIATAAAVTSTLRVGARVFCIDYHQPVVLAKTAATLDLLSDGRLELGLGAGWVKSEYESMGLPMDTAGVRIQRLADYVDFVKQFFSGEPLDIDSAAASAHGFRGEPVLKRQPPIMIGGGGRKVLTLAGRLADIVSFNFNNAEGKVGANSVRSSSGALMNERVGWVREGAGDRFASIELEVGGYFLSVTDNASATAEKFGAGFGLSAEEMLEHPNALIGTVDAICDRLVERRERYGISYVMVSTRSIDVFAPVVARLAGT